VSDSRPGGGARARGQATGPEDDESWWPPRDFDAMYPRTTRPRHRERPHRGPSPCVAGDVSASARPCSYSALAARPSSAHRPRSRVPADSNEPITRRPRSSLARPRSPNALRRATPGNAAARHPHIRGDDHHRHRDRAIEPPVTTTDTGPTNKRTTEPGHRPPTPSRRSSNPPSRCTRSRATPSRSPSPILLNNSRNNRMTVITKPPPKPRSRSRRTKCPSSPAQQQGPDCPPSNPSQRRRRWTRLQLTPPSPASVRVCCDTPRNLQQTCTARARVFD